MAAYGHIAKGPVRRYDLPNLRALNFVIENALGGGVTRSLRQDMHGKSLSSLMLTIELPGHNEETRNQVVRRGGGDDCAVHRLALDTDAVSAARTICRAVCTSLTSMAVNGPCSPDVNAAALAWRQAWALTFFLSQPAR